MTVGSALSGAALISLGWMHQPWELYLGWAFGTGLGNALTLYGDLCQAITNLVFERAKPFDTDEFRILTIHDVGRQGDDPGLLPRGRFLPDAGGGLVDGVLNFSDCHPGVCAQDACNMRQAKATKCKPARVSGKRS